MEARGGRQRTDNRLPRPTAAREPLRSGWKPVLLHSLEIVANLMPANRIIAPFRSPMVWSTSTPAMPGLAAGASAATHFDIGMPTAHGCETPERAFAHSASRDSTGLPGTSGSARSRTATCRRPASMRGAASNTAITSNGARCRTRPSSIDSRPSAARCPRFAVASRAIWRMEAKAAARPEVVLATMVHLLDTTFLRVGNEEYASSNGSYGLTTLRNRHADVRGSALKLRFRGKSGVHARGSGRRSTRHEGGPSLPATAGPGTLPVRGRGWRTARASPQPT